MATQYKFEVTVNLGSGKYHKLIVKTANGLFRAAIIGARDAGLVFDEAELFYSRDEYDNRGKIVRYWVPYIDAIKGSQKVAIVWVRPLENIF